MKANSEQNDSEPLIDFAILTAIEVERRAVCEVLGLTSDEHRVRREGRLYWRGSIKLKDGSTYNIVVAQPTDMANVPMAILTNDTIQQWKPNAILMVGIAGAANEKVELGDIVLGKQIYYYERGKVTPEGKEPEPILFSSDHLLLDAAIKLPEWDPQIKVPRPDKTNDKPNIWDGVIACGDKVIADELTKEKITEPHRKILAIEMEGYGFIEAARQSIYRPRFLVIRAICDKANTQKSDEWHSYAASAVASFTKHFLEDRPIDPRNEQTRHIPKRLDNIASHIGKESVEQKIIEPEQVSVRDSQGPSVSQIDSSSQLEKLISLLSQEKATRIDELREKFNEGKVRDAYELIQSMQLDLHWETLSNSVRAKALRAMAFFTLDLENDVEKARQQMETAKQADPEGDDIIIRSWVLFYERKPQEALQLVSTPASTEAFNLRVNLLLLLGRIDEVLNSIEHPPGGVALDMETKRVKALALMAHGDLGNAEKELYEVISKYPRRENVQTQSAILDYLSGLSPAAVPHNLIDWPEPVDFTFIKQDRESQERFRKAGDKFQSILAETQRDEEYKRIIEIWRFACLANDLERQDEAVKLCSDILRNDPANHRILIWAIVRGLGVDLSPSEIALRQSLDTNDEKEDGSLVEKITVLTALYLRLGKASMAAELLDTKKEVFYNIGAEDRLHLWKSRALVVLEQYGKAMAEAVGVGNTSRRRMVVGMILQAMASKTDYWQPYIDYLKESYEQTKDGDYLLQLFNIRKA